jgi:hypothetical protein
MMFAADSSGNQADGRFSCAFAITLVRKTLQTKYQTIAHLRYGGTEPKGEDAVDVNKYCALLDF